MVERLETCENQKNADRMQEATPLSTVNYVEFQTPLQGKLKPLMTACMYSRDSPLKAARLWLGKDLKVILTWKLEKHSKSRKNYELRAGYCSWLTGKTPLL